MFWIYAGLLVITLRYIGRRGTLSFLNYDDPDYVTVKCRSHAEASQPDAGRALQ